MAPAETLRANSSTPGLISPKPRPNLPPWRCVVMMNARTPEAAEDLADVSDEVLLGRYRDEGRTADFNALVQRYERELYRYLTRYVGDSALAEDVFQNTFLQVHLKR